VRKTDGTKGGLRETARRVVIGLISRVCVSLLARTRVQVCSTTFTSDIIYPAVRLFHVALIVSSSIVTILFVPGHR